MAKKSIGHFQQSVHALAFATAFALAANAPAQAGCFVSGQEIPSEQIGAFTANPGSFLSGSPEGGIQLSSKIRDLVGSNPDTLQPVLGLLKNANTDQKKGIGSGLREANAACQGQEFASTILTKLTATGDRVALDAYLSDSGGDPEVTGSVGGGAGGSGGGVGGPTTGTATNGGANSSQPAASGKTATDNVPTNYFTGGGVTSSSILSTSAF